MDIVKVLKIYRVWVADCCRCFLEYVFNCLTCFLWAVGWEKRFRTSICGWDCCCSKWKGPCVDGPKGEAIYDARWHVYGMVQYGMLLSQFVMLSFHEFSWNVICELFCKDAIVGTATSSNWATKTPLNREGPWCGAFATCGAPSQAERQTELVILWWESDVSKLIFV